MSDEIILKSNELIFEGWEEFSIYKTINAVAGSYSLQYKKNIEDVAKLFTQNNPCVLKIGKEIVFTGFIEFYKSETNSKEIILESAGRSKTCDIIDCTVQPPYSLKNLTAKEIISKLISPFSLTLNYLVAENPKFSNWDLNPGDSVWSSIERLSRIMGFLVTCNNLGEVVVKKVGEKSADIILTEESIEKVFINSNSESLFSDYVAMGQSEENFQVTGSAKDKTIGRYRPHYFHCEVPVDPGQAEKRAQWQAIVNNQRAVDFTIVVDEWRQTAGGRLWVENEKVKIIYPFHGIDDEFLISGVKLLQSKRHGRKTFLELERSDAFNPRKEIS